MRPSRPVALRGTVWRGDGSPALPDHIVLVRDGVVADIKPYEPTVIDDALIVGSDRSWVGPGVFDRHVHLAFGAAHDMCAGGVVAARDLGAPAQARFEHDGLQVSRAGQMLTAPHGYPSQTWGADGFAAFAHDPEEAAVHCRAMHATGASVIKVALEDADGQPPLNPDVLGAAVATAHELGLPVIAHALSVAMVNRALDAQVDELAHTPTELLDADSIGRIATSGISVCSTLQTFFAEGKGEIAARNAESLIEAGVPLNYATDFGNAGTRPGVDPRELDRLARAGLGREGALMTAIVAPVETGGPAQLVVLPEDPFVEPTAWWTPSLVQIGTYRHHGE